MTYAGKRRKLARVKKKLDKFREELNRVDAELEVTMTTIMLEELFKYYARVSIGYES